MKNTKSLLAVLIICLISILAIACGPVNNNKELTVTIPENTVGYTVEGEDSVAQGANYTFKVTIADGYEKTENFAVKVNGNKVDVDEQGNVTLENVAEDIVITVEGVALDGYTVSMPAEMNGYVITGANTAAHGADYSFKVEFLEGYEAADGFAVKVNGTAVEIGEDGSVTVENVTSDIVISVDGGVTRKIYTTTLSSGEGYTVVGAESVEHGSDYTFTVTLLEGYEKVTGFVVKVNGGFASLDADGKVTVENVTSDLVIEVKGVGLITYYPTLPSSKGYTVTGAETVKYGSSYTFTVTLSEGYKKTAGFAVKVNGETVALDAEGKVTVENVTSALTVKVEGVEIITYSATLPTGVGYTVTGAEVLEYGKDYTYTVVIAGGYTATSLYKVTVNGNEVTVSDNGSFTVTSVKEDIVIAVEGIADEGAFDLGDGEVENDDQWWN